MQIIQEINDTRKGELEELFRALEEVRRFSGPPQEFWPAFLEVSSRLAEARFGFLLVRSEEEKNWKTLGLWPVGAAGDVRELGVGPDIEGIAEDAALAGFAWRKSDTKGPAFLGLIMGVRLELGDETRTGVAAFFVESALAGDPEEVMTRVKLAADIPAAYQLNRTVRQARYDVVQFGEALDLMVLLNAETRFMGAAMTLCNEIASRYHCGRVSLGWVKRAYVRVQAISHMERFEKKMDAVQGLEAAMEEALDQDEEVIWPRPEESLAVVRDHEAFARDQGAEFMVSIPIRVDDEPVGVLTCERADTPFSEVDVRGLRVLCDQAARRIADLKTHDRWIGARMVSSLRSGLARLVGVEHTFPKILGLIVCAALAFAIFGQLPYRVEAPFILRTDDLAYLPAPFDGYIKEVHVKVGDRIGKGESLLSLDTRELLLEESNAIANQHRYSREAEKARAQNALADMRIATALNEQARAQLELVRYHLSHAEIRAPFAGIVVEGDLKELLGAPVRKGDVLFKVALLEKMYGEIEVPEKDVHEVASDATGEIAFVSRPQLKFPITVEQIEPVAIPKEDGNVFLLRAVLPEQIPQWWRPGMSGVTKINVGPRNVLWILSHRTVDFFRILLWW